MVSVLIKCSDGGTGDDIILGDQGYFDYTLPLSNNVKSFSANITWGNNSYGVSDDKVSYIKY